MGFWSKLFGGGGGKESGGGSGKGRDGVNQQLPSTMVAKEFGEVNVKRRGKELEILFTILMEPTDAEGWQTGVALDASGSMLGAFGKDIEPGPKGNPPQNLLQDYQRRGWLELFEHPQIKGQIIPIFHLQAKSDLVTKGYCRWTKNEVEPLARQVTAYLASNLDADGGTTVIYWACGDGKQLEVIGDLTSEECEGQQFGGPTKVDFGAGTCLEPAVRYFAERFADAKNGMYIFITDGELNDLPEVKRFTVQMCREIAAKKRNPLKCVLIGVGEGINEGQMEELDDLDSGTDVDIWDHKIAKDMRSLIEIFAEVVSENQIVADTGRVYDSAGQVVKQFNDGLPARVSFTMPVGSEFFELEVNGERIKQSVVVPK